MSHRMALTLAVALTLLFAAGVVAGRDRLLGDATVAEVADPTTTATTTATTTTAGDSGSDRVIEVTVPAGALAGAALSDAVAPLVDQEVAPAFAEDDDHDRERDVRGDRRDDERRGDDHDDDDHHDEDDHDD